MEQTKIVSFKNVSIAEENVRENVHQIKKELNSFIANCRQYSRNFKNGVCNFEDIDRGEHISIIYEAMADELDKIVKS